VKFSWAISHINSLKTTISGTTFVAIIIINLYCTEYKYLGMIINREGTNDSKINARIKIGRYATSRLNSVL
jgi:hypothetical protein